MIIIKPKPGESQSAFLARFKGKVKQEDLISEIRGRMEYKKPSQIKQDEIKKKRNKIHKYKRDIGKF